MTLPITGYMSVAEASRRSGMDMSAIRRAAREGNIPGAVKMGDRAWLIPVTAIEEGHLSRPQGRPKKEKKTNG